MPHDDHFRVDGFSGAVEIMNMASEFMDHEIVLVTARDSAITVTSPPIGITTRCGPESTHIEALILTNIVGDPGAVDFSLTDRFESTNALCPIEASILPAPVASARPSSTATTSSSSRTAPPMASPSPSTKSTRKRWATTSTPSALVPSVALTATLPAI